MSVYSDYLLIDSISYLAHWPETLRLGDLGCLRHHSSPEDRRCSVNADRVNEASGGGVSLNTEKPRNKPSGMPFPTVARTLGG